MSLNEGNKTMGLKGKICKNDGSYLYPQCSKEFRGQRDSHSASCVVKDIPSTAISEFLRGAFYPNAIVEETEAEGRVVTN